MRVAPSTKILAESSKKDCPSDVSLGERNPNQCSPSSNGTFTLTGAPLPGTRAATHWQRQRGTRNRRHFASNSCTGSCGKAGSPHTIMLQVRWCWKCFARITQKIDRYAWMVNSKGTTHSSYQKASPVRRQNYTFYLKCVTVGELTQNLQNFRF